MPKNIGLKRVPKKLLKPKKIEIPKVAPRTTATKPFGAIDIQQKIKSRLMNARRK